MKRRLLCLIFILWPLGARSSGIVNNAGTAGAEDSISFVVNSLDSLGNPVSADTFYVLVLGPRGDSLFSEKGTNAALAHIDSALMGGYTTYIFKAQVSDIDGAGAVGKYTCQIMARKSSPLYRTVTVGEFQITSAELSDALDSAGIAARGGVFTTAQRDSILSALADAVLGNKVWNRPFTSSFAPGSMGDSLTDGSDSLSIARWVWNTPQANHVTNGTFGKYLDAEVSSLAAGAGAWSFAVVAVDSVSYQVVPNAVVSIRNTEQTALVAVGTTNSLGRAWFNLNSGPYLAIISSPGYIFPSCDTFVVSGSGSATLFGHQFNPGAPSSPLLCRVFGYLYGVSGLPEPDLMVTATLPKGVVRSGNLVVSPFAVSARSDTTGYFYLDLIPSDSLSPSGSSYEISISRTDGTILRKRLTVPSQSNWRLTW